MNNLHVYRSVFGLLLFALIQSCSSLPEKPWYEIVPKEAVAVYIPEDGSTISSILDSKAGSFFDDISTSALPVNQKFEVAVGKRITVKAMLFYPSEGDKTETVWVTEFDNDGVTKLKKIFFRPLYKDYYLFQGVTISQLYIDGLTIFALENGDTVYFSESSKALESIILTLNSTSTPITFLPKQLQQKQVVLINTQHFDQVLAQHIAVKFKPHLLESFNGMGPASLSYTAYETDELSFGLRALIPLNQPKSLLTSALSTKNEEITLDQYIPIDAAFFSAHFTKPTPFAVTEINSKLDSVLKSEPSLLTKLSDALDYEVAVAGFAPAGLVGVGENLYIRKIRDTSILYNWLRDMENRGLIINTDRNWYLRSSTVADVISGGLSAYDTFYLGISSEAVVISPRLGLTNKVRSDRSRRRVLAFNKTYLDIKSSFEGPSSSFFYVESKGFESFVQHYLNPNAKLTIFTSKFELLAGKMELDNSSNSIVAHINGYTKKRSNQPFEERWIAPYDGDGLTGKPILVDIGGNARPEILIATTGGMVLGIASDGTTYFSAKTGEDTPLGSPIVYDWYGNRQNAIFIAAGNKIYAWNSSGTPLPQFPIILKEQLSSPLSIIDINRDGKAELVVTTQDRFVHVLNGRGEALKGWPTQTSAPVKLQPHFDQIGKQWALMVQAENGIFAYDSKGSLLNGFPIFVTGGFSTTPKPFEGGILMGGTDGLLYYLGEKRMFTDSLNIFSNTPYDSISSSLKLSARYISNTAINATPFSAKKLTIITDSVTTITENMLITQSADGSIFVLNEKGELRFTVNMGQPSSDNAGLILYDLQKDGRPELLATAGFGRLYAWELYRGNRYFDLPTNAVDFPVLADIDGDGFPELIAQTRGGLRCWSIYGNKN